MNTYQILSNDQDPYASTIASYVKQQFPLFLGKDDHNLVDFLTDSIVGTGQVRFGPKPAIESLVLIRDVIRKAVADNRPIPFLVAWGSEKPDGSSVDLAELYALKTISCLDSRVKTHYLPGIVARVRVEDASAPYLFFDRAEEARKQAADYTSAFVRLNAIVGMEHFVRIVPESTMTSEAAFNTEADKLLPAVEARLSGDMQAVTPLKANEETIAFYMRQYAKLYPEKSIVEHRHILARYFASALARYSLGIRGDDNRWQGSYIDLSFVQPTPGFSGHQRRVYYRTLPSNISSNHLPPWRAKGYLLVGDTICAKLATFHDQLDYNRFDLTLSNGSMQQSVRADYVIAS